MFCKNILAFVLLLSCAEIASAQDFSAFEKSFKQLSNDEKKSIQKELRDYGVYSGEIDGIWGRNTANAIIGAYNDVYQNYPEGMWDTEGKFLAYILEPYEFWGEGDECDGCETGDVYETKNQLVENSSEKSSSYLEFFQDLAPSCNALNTSAFGAQATEWSNLGGSRSLMYELDGLLDSLFDGDEETFQQLIALSKKFQNFPPLQFWLGYAYWQRNKFHESLIWLSKASQNGEPNAAYLIAIIALNYIHPDDKLKIDESFPRSPLDIKIAMECLETTLATDENLFVHSVPHSSYFIQSAAELLVPIYLQDKGLLYEDPEQQDFSVDWVGEPNVERAVKIIDSYRKPTDSCNATCWDRYQVVALDFLTKQKNLKEAAAEEKRLSVSLSETQMEIIKSRCSDLISLSGICWELTIEEMEAVLMTREFACQNEMNPFNGVNEIICRKESKEIRISPSLNRASFNCHTFGLCDYSFEESLQIILREKLVENLIKDQKFGNNFGGDPFWTYTACGRGVSGDELCLSFSDQDFLSVFGTTLTLSKGTYGSSGPSFD